VKAPWLDEVLSGRIKEFDAHASNIGHAGRTRVISFAVPVRSSFEGMKTIGAVVFEYDVRDLRQTVVGEGRQGVVIFDGRGEIVTAFPEPGPPVRISEGGGVGSAWAPDGSGIFYAGPDSMIRVSVAVGRDGRQVRSHRSLFAHSGFEVTTAAFFQALGFPRRYDVHPRGDRLLMVRSLEETFNLGVPIRIVTNWFEEVRQRTREGGTQ